MPSVPIERPSLADPNWPPPLTELRPAEPNLLPNDNAVIQTSAQDSLLSEDGPSGTVDTSDPELPELSDSEPWFLLPLTSLVAVGSSIGMLFFGWLTFDYRSRYLELLRDSVDSSTSWLETPINETDPDPLLAEDTTSATDSHQSSEEQHDAPASEDSAWRDLGTDTEDGLDDWLNEGKRSRSPVSTQTQEIALTIPGASCKCDPKEPRMKAAVYEGNRRFVTAASDPVPPQAGEVRLNVAYCGVCGTDVHIYHGAMDGRVGPPKIIGHEASAEVAEIGEGVEGFAVGDCVAVRPLQFGEPTSYDKGCPHVGKNLKFIGIDTPGAMQGSWTVPAYTLHKLPGSLSLQHGALIEPVAVACHDVRLGEVQPGEHCVVLGGGPIGLLIALVARHEGANVLVSEVNPTRIALANSMGLRTVNPLEQDLAAEVAAWSSEAMADVGF